MAGKDTSTISTAISTSETKTKTKAKTTKTKTKRKKRNTRKGEQMALPRTAGHGGKRPGAGRKPREGRRNVPHVTRPRLGKKTPVHVTLRAHKRLPSFRSEIVKTMFDRIVVQTRREDFHVPVYDLQQDHIHMICEPDDREATSAGSVAS